MDSQQERNDLRDRIVGLGSVQGRKTYYPELKKKLQELERFKTLIDASGEMILLVELPAGEIRDCNKIVYEKLGNTKQEVTSLKIEEILFCPDKNNCIECLKDDRTLKRCNIHSSTQKIIPVELNINVVQFESTDFMVIVATDITKRLEYENEIISSEHKFHAVFDNFFQLTGILTPQGILIDVNQTALSLVGVTKEEVIGKYLWDCIWFNHSENEIVKLKDGIKKALQGELVRFTTTHKTVSGEIRYIDFSIKPVENSFHEIIYLIPEGRDTTENRVMSMELEKTKKLLDTILESMASGIITLDKDNIILHINTFAKTILQLQQEYIIGSNFFDVLDDNLFAKVKRMIKELNNDALSNSLIIPVHSTEITKFLEFTVYHLKRYDGNGVVIRIDNVTERVKFTELIIQSEKMMTVGGLAAGMAHEINNPLNIIHGSIQNTNRRLSLDIPDNVAEANRLGLDLGKVREYLENRKIFYYINGAQEAVVRASRIISDMLLFSRKSENKKYLCNVNEVIEKSIEILNSDFKYKEIMKKYTVFINFDYSKPIQAMICYNEIEQVLINLLKNGVEAFEGKEKQNDPNQVEITTQYSDDGHFVEISICDNGVGIPNANRNKIFEPFYTTKSIGKGTGLGLSIVYYIIKDRHDGHLSVNSIEGIKTEFIIKLPVKS
ncbi:MAG: hypothetical protein A2015_12045 [Spirochaetes bacterium GWF1_31_7]|nr:MAG: hypothetical protein A2Y30_15030 [Spirochaetes bacterium GWE1_32_154]OHD49148.1 MAG: hypothetical protein A2015_12045 [Spirochaetes bacterium GWF1_31_7]OHD50267.1 MAG: hypothetical protein A2Y29_13080 [Spirochaetes bacterium GWE2_31_10]OHD76595.1 MAG: hypothetical protein A2355_13475 [Spirochaetes bacterium RIFOXYB1_FULL_32_8]HBD93949.1 hypothetical protein [Spirochaetia bacterium]